jgi:hypothetical protein
MVLRRLSRNADLLQLETKTRDEELSLKKPPSNVNSQTDQANTGSHQASNSAWSKYRRKNRKKANHPGQMEGRMKVSRLGLCQNPCCRKNWKPPNPPCHMKIKIEMSGLSLRQNPPNRRVARSLLGSLRRIAGTVENPSVRRHFAANATAPGTA